jgi:hypothetical protein
MDVERTDTLVIKIFVCFHLLLLVSAHLNLQKMKPGALSNKEVLVGTSKFTLSSVSLQPYQIADIFVPPFKAENNVCHARFSSVLILQKDLKTKARAMLLFRVLKHPRNDRLQDLNLKIPRCHLIFEKNKFVGGEVCLIFTCISYSHSIFSLSGCERLVDDYNRSTNDSDEETAIAIGRHPDHA